MRIKSHFKPAWWLKNPHLQTIFPALLRRKVQIETRRERFELADGDFLDLDWVGGETGPIVIVLHGLGGSVNSHYARGLLRQLANANMRGVFMHFRGCSGEPNRLVRSYHSGETNDISEVVAFLQQCEPKTPLAVVGFSLGGNVVLKWLGEKKHQPVFAAVAVSVPFELQKAADRVNRGLSRLYQWRLLRTLHEAVRLKEKKIKLPFDVEKALKAKSFWQFDTLVTAPIHNFKDVHHYYNASSCRQFLNKITVPTLILHAKDDPFMTQDAIATEIELSEKITLELSERGGHLGFVTGKFPWAARYWLEERIVQYLKAEMKAHE